MSIRPILGAKATSLSQIKLPCFASYKVDGWRAIWQGVEFFTRSGKCIPNRALQSYAVQNVVPVGWDGEIIVGEPNASNVFSVTDKFCKTFGAPIPTVGVRFFVFDHVLVNDKPFFHRMSGLYDLPPFIFKLDQTLIETYDALEEFEARAVALGYEGIVTRSPTGPYKNGRSTMREQYLVKVKRYIDEEVKIIGFEEQMHNANPATQSELGYTKRSSHKDGKIPAGTLGKVIVEWRGKALRVGTGFDDRMRAEIWNNQDRFLGKTLTIRFSPPTKDLPRQPVWKGIRSDL